MKTNQDRKTLLLEAKDIHSIISKVGVDRLMDELIEELRTALFDFDPKELHIPKRDGFNYTLPAAGLVEWMPLYRVGEEVLIKVVGYHPEAPGKFGVPTILSTISLYDTATGHLKGLVDGVLLTALRTGAASAVATDVLARRDTESILGLIGAGAQAVTQLHAISRVRPITKVLYWDLESSTRKSFADRVAVLGLDIDIVPASYEEILAQSDIVCTATSVPVGQGPIFNHSPTKPHVHFNAVGSDFPGKVELPLQLLQESLVVPDFREQATIEGECQQLAEDPASIGMELDALIKQSSDYHVTYSNQKTVFDSTGWALEDYVATHLVLRYANQFDIGTYATIEYMPADEKNPYEFLRSHNDRKSENLSGILRPAQARSLYL
ncbi:MAG: ornithine cyclodeaminase family protein [Saprospiraceae bacterium]|nr:ornithine cyclodeaminase family protein [Saprospiraceae bacterium]